MAAHETEPVGESLQEYGRGIAGGLMFSLPLLYTMEVWWAGFLLDSGKLLVSVVATFFLLLAYNRFSGLHPGVRLLDVVIDSVEEFGIGILLSALILYVLGRISPEMPREEILGKIIVESLLVSIGVSVGTAQLGMTQERDEEGSEEEGPEEEEAESDDPERTPLSKQAALAMCGAILFAANVAPTEEIVVIATEATPMNLLALIGLSLAMGALILYFSSFHQSRQAYPPSGLLVGSLEVACSYAVALIASAGVLWFFGRFEGVSLAVGIAEVVVLGFAAALGASAGRLLIE